MITQDVIDQEIQRLVRVYRDTINDIAKKIFGAMDMEKLRLYAIANQVFEEIKKLDMEAQAWSRNNIRGLFRATIAETEKQIRGMGMDRITIKSTQAFSVVSTDAVKILLLDPETGFLPNLYEATAEIVARIKSIQNQVTVLKGQSRLMNETIARVGVLQGENLTTVKKSLLDELLSSKGASEMVWRKKVGKTGGSLFKNLADIPYIRIPTVQGERAMRLDRYVELVARTKTAQAQETARRITYMRHKIGLVIFSNNRSLWGDACDIFVGRVFALTAEEAKDNGVAHINELPSGGIPLHPNCTHNSSVYFEGLLPPQQDELAMTRPPEWALNRPWQEVQREYKQRGGLSVAAQLNPMFPFAVKSGGWQRRNLKKGKRRK